MSCASGCRCLGDGMSCASPKRVVNSRCNGMSCATADGMSCASVDGMEWVVLLQME